MWDKENGEWIGSSSVPEPNDICEVNTHLGLPEVEDCSSATVPPVAEAKPGKKTILIPELVSMWKYLLSRNLGNQRLKLYSFLNQELRNGHMSSVVGFKVLNKVINKEACRLADVDFWEIDGNSFFADVCIELTLQSENGLREWTGYLVCWCSFNDEGFRCSVEELTDDPEHSTDDFTLLDPFLVPYYTNQKIDEIAEHIWLKYGMEAALTDPTERDAVKLAQRMGLSIEYHPVYEHMDVNSILFFSAGDLFVGIDKKRLGANGRIEHIKDEEPRKILIPANTIVINTNRVQKEYASFSILHECTHHELHYLFFRLQQMGSNDIRKVKAKRVEAQKGKKYRNPVYFMEKQATRGAFGLMMPVSHTREMIINQSIKATGYQNFGEKFQIVGIELARSLHLPRFRVRARMIQLGFIEAKGALNYVSGGLIDPFAFDLESWKESDISFVIDPCSVDRLYEKTSDFKKIIDSGEYIYADGHIVRNEPRFVTTKDDGSRVLTDAAKKSVDVCCLRFVRRYVQKDVGKYVYGQMFFDPRYVEQTNFYLSDLINERQMDELDARMRYKETFPRTFVGAFDMLMKQNGETRESIAPQLHTTERSLREWLNEPERKISADFVVGISLMWQVPDWISKMLLDRACIRLSEFDRRHQALEYIRTVLWDRGIEEANEYLASKGLDPLEI